MSRHVLVARLDNDGDVLLAGPAVRAVAANADRVTLLCGPRGVRAARLLPGVDEIVVWRAPWIDPQPEPVDPGDVAATVRTLAQLRADEALVLTSFHQSPLPLALLLRLASVPKVAAICDDYPGSLLDVRHRVPDGLHEVERMLSLAAAAGCPLPEVDDGRLQVVRTHTDVTPLVGSSPYVVVHPGASVPARAWAPERCAELVAALAARGDRVVVTGGPEEVSLTAYVAGEHAVDLGGRTDFGMLAEALAGADVVVVGNTGPAHLAAAVGTPVVSVFAATVPVERWRPWAVPQVLLGDQSVPCGQCRARACPVPGHPCVGSVTVADVVSAVDALRSRTVEVACAS